MSNEEHIEVYECDGKVVIGTPGGNATFDPPIAVDVATSLIKCAAACGYRVEVVIPKYKVSSALRAVLIGRIARVVQSQRQDNVDSARSASSIVDTILAEIC